MSKETEQVKEMTTFMVDGSSELTSLPKNVKKIRLDNSNSRLFYRVSGEVGNVDATIVVSEPNKAIIYRDGVSSGVLSSGAYPIYTAEQKEKKGFWIFKKEKLKETYIIDVVVYNPSFTYKGTWGTIQPIPYRDPETQIPVDLKGRGTYDLRIADINKFHETLIGSSKDVTVDSLIRDRINPFIYQIVKNELAKVIHSLHLGYVDLPLHELDIAKAIQPIISEELNEQYGLYIPLFTIEEFTIDESKRAQIENKLAEDRDETKYKKDVKELATELERLEDKEWEKQKFLIGLRREDYDKYLEVVKILGLTKIEGDSKVDNKEVKSRNFCPKCGEPVSPNVEYCPNCGTKVGEKERTCPHCGKQVKTNGKYCPHCGKEM